MVACFMPLVSGELLLNGFGASLGYPALIKDFACIISAIPFWNLKKAHFILMQDDEYRSINMQFGGIFISSNKNPSMWQQLWRKEYV